MIGRSHIHWIAIGLGLAALGGMISTEYLRFLDIKKAGIEQQQHLAKRTIPSEADLKMEERINAAHRGDRPLLAFLYISGGLCFFAFSVLLIAYREARSVLSWILWLAWLPFLCTGITD